MKLATNYQSDKMFLLTSARSNLVPYTFVWEKGKTMDFSETIVIYDLKLATDHVLNHEKNCIKSDFKEIFLKLATNYQSDKMFLLTSARSNLVPYTFVWEKGKTMDFSETIVIYDLKLATDDRSDKTFLLTAKLFPGGGGGGGGLYAPCPGAIYMY